MKLAPFLICLLLLFDNTLLTTKTNDTPLFKLKRSIDSAMLGGVPHPSSSVLRKMHQSKYILHAQDGKLNKFPVEKSILPHDPKAHPQAVDAMVDPDGIVYVPLASIICKSSDGGKTWTSRPKHPSIINAKLQILPDGTMIAYSGGEKVDEPIIVSASSDRGSTWVKRSEIPPPKGHWGGINWTTNLPGDVLLASVGVVNHVFQKRQDNSLSLVSGGGFLRTLRSTDKGKTWHNPAKLHNWGSEGGAVVTASEKILAVVRYQRPVFSSDPPNIEKKTGSISPGWAFKHVFLMDSYDQGHSWKNFRPLATVFGQTYGYPAALSDGTVIVVHDTRYGPGLPGSRAMISFDEGNTWEDQVYYLDHTTFTGSYNSSVVLKDDVILTIVGSSQAGNDWKSVTGNSEFFAIRWTPKRPVKRTKDDVRSIPWSKSQTKISRIDVRQKSRRLIYNDDGEELAHLGASTPKGFLAPRLKDLAGTQVDTIAWSILSNWGDAPSYNSKVQPIHGNASGGPPPNFQPYAKNLKTLIKNGYCPLQIVTRFAHKNNMELLASVRMNDVHDSFVRGLMTTWKKEHPEFLVNKTNSKPNMSLYKTAQDYSHPEVRQRKFEIFEEVCQRYNIDGFELDFIRHPVFFSPTMEGKEVTSDQMEIMTSFVRRIRYLTEKTGAHRHRPVLIAVRIPDTLALSKRIGLDVETWIEEDLIDLIIVGGGYAPFTLDISKIKKLAKHYQIPVYPCLNQKPPTYEVLTKNATLANRGLASNWYNQGANGIYLWNLGVPLTHPRPRDGKDLTEARKLCYGILTHLGNINSLQKKDKIFSLDGPVFNYYSHISGKTSLPQTLSPGENLPINLEIGDNFGVVSKATSDVKLKLVIKGKIKKQVLQFKLNGHPLVKGQFLKVDVKEKTSVTFKPDLSFFQKGKNSIQVFLDSADISENMELQLVNIELTVRYLEGNL
jgi:hypothetical protein